MQLNIPFEAALILHRSTLRQDYPETFKRFEEQSTVYVGASVLRARVRTHTGDLDLHIIRDYFELWLNARDLIPDDCKDAEAKALVRYAQDAVYQLTRTIAEVEQRLTATRNLD